MDHTNTVKEQNAHGLGGGLAAQHFGRTFGPSGQPLGGGLLCLWLKFMEPGLIHGYDLFHESVVPVQESQILLAEPQPEVLLFSSQQLGDELAAEFGKSQILVHNSVDS